jgi:steroid delta-isomerase-like uncharacterized protein
MSVVRNKEIVRRDIEEIWNRGKLDVADATYAPTAQIHDPVMRTLPLGPEGVKQFARTLRDSFPDLHLHIDDIVAEGDIVAVRYHSTGTHRQPFMGIPATGRFATVPGLGMHRIENERVVETWLQWDVVGMLEGMGLELPIKGGVEAHT